MLYKCPFTLTISTVRPEMLDNGFLFADYNNHILEVCIHSQMCKPCNVNSGHLERHFSCGVLHTAFFVCILLYYVYD